MNTGTSFRLATYRRLSLSKAPSSGGEQVRVGAFVREDQLRHYLLELWRKEGKNVDIDGRSLILGVV